MTATTSFHGTLKVLNRGLIVLNPSIDLNLRATGSFINGSLTVLPKAKVFCESALNQLSGKIQLNASSELWFRGRTDVYNVRFDSHPLSVAWVDANAVVRWRAPGVFPLGGWRTRDDTNIAVFADVKNVIVTILSTLSIMRQLDGWCYDGCRGGGSYTGAGLCMQH